MADIMQPQAVAVRWQCEKENHMTFFEIDTGSSGSSGPFLSWQARESVDGQIPGRNFVMRQNGEKIIVTDNFKKGVVFDLKSLKTGWCFSTGAPGQAPQWKWNASLSKYEPSPGDGWKKGMSIRVALDKETAATLEQSSAAVMSMLGEIGTLVRNPEAQKNLQAGKLPVITLDSVEKVDSKLGTTFVPRVAIKAWVDRPDVLGGSDGGIEIDAGAPIATKAPAKKANAEALEF
jgi:hypothetical protein